MMKVVCLNDFQEKDPLNRFAAALRSAEEQQELTIIVPSGDYCFSTPLAQKTMKDVISGKYGENPENDMFHADFAFSTGLLLEHLKNVTIIGYGARLLIDGFMEPIAVHDCTDITLEGFSIDYIRKPYSRGVITHDLRKDENRREGALTVCFDSQYPVDEHTIMPRWCIYNTHLHRFQMDTKVVTHEFIGNQLFRFTMSGLPENDLSGMEFYVWHSFHYRPAIMLEESHNITLRDITIHAQPGMGVIGHRCENIIMERLQVIPSHGENMSTNTDATHFTSCKGKIVFQDCRFEGNGDDVTNVHTFYHHIKPMEKDTYIGSVDVKTHSLTLDYPDVGDTMELVRKDSLLREKTYHVISLRKEKDCYFATLDGELPPNAEENYYLANITRSPEVQFLNCDCHSHWARSVLLKCKKALVEGCRFSCSALWAIHVAAEGWWREGVACENIIIRNNRFVDCGTASASDVGGIKIEMSVDHPSGTPQKHIFIENNLFDLPLTEYAVWIANAQDVLLKNNRYLHCKKAVSVHDCLNVRNEDAVNA